MQIPAEARAEAHGRDYNRVKNSIGLLYCMLAQCDRSLVADSLHLSPDNRRKSQPSRHHKPKRKKKKVFKN